MLSHPKTYVATLCNKFYDAYIYNFSLGDVQIGCRTRNIPGVRSPNAQCIFPFKYNGTMEHKCLQSPAWCSTLVDDDTGAHIGGWQRNRGYCEDGCNLKIGKKDFIRLIFDFFKTI